MIAPATAADPTLSLIHDLIRALEDGDAEALLDLFGFYEKKPLEGARELAHLACRLFRDRVQEVVRVDARRCDGDRMRGLVRVLTRYGDLASVPVSGYLDRNRTWCADGVELHARWFGLNARDRSEEIRRPSQEVLDIIANYQGPLAGQ